MLSVVTVRVKVSGCTQTCFEDCLLWQQTEFVSFVCFPFGASVALSTNTKAGQRTCECQAGGLGTLGTLGGVPKMRGTIPVSAVINALYSRHMNCSVTLLTFWTWMPCQTCQDSNWNRYVARIHRVCWARRVAVPGRRATLSTRNQIEPSLGGLTLSLSSFHLLMAA